MAQLIVRKLDNELIKRLKLRAAKHGRSVEAEHRAILQSVVMDETPVNFKDWLLALPDLDIELSIERDNKDKGRDVTRLFD